MHNHKTRTSAAISFFLIVPWHVNLLLGEAVFVTCKWILPAFSAADAAFKPGMTPWSNMAEVLASIFLLFGAIIFAAQKKKWLANFFHDINRTRITPQQSSAPRN